MAGVFRRVSSLVARIGRKDRTRAANDDEQENKRKDKKGRRNKAKFTEAKVTEGETPNDADAEGALTEIAEGERARMGARDGSPAANATRADIHVADDTSAQAAASESSGLDDMSEDTGGGGGGGKKKRGRKGKKNKSKLFNSSKDGSGTSQQPKDPTGDKTVNGPAAGNASTENGEVGEVAERDIIVSVAASQLSSAAPPDKTSAGIQNGEVGGAETRAKSSDFLVDGVAGKKEDSRKERGGKNNTEPGQTSGDKNESAGSVTNGGSPVLSGAAVSSQNKDGTGDTDSLRSRDSLAEIEAEAEAMLALADVSMSTVSSESLATDTSEGGGTRAGSASEKDKDKAKSTGGGLKKILRRKISQTLFNVDLEQCDPEICVSILKIPTVQNLGAIKKKLKNSGKEWMQGFLDNEGLEALLDCIDSLGSRRVTQLSDALLLLECVACVKCVMNSKMGLELLVQRPDYVCRLVKGRMQLRHFRATVNVFHNAAEGSL
nr:hypothetical protein BaRGS_027667 [Batillaria attramentaria]